MKLKGAKIILECLLEQEIHTVFGYPGGAVLHLYDALYEYRDRITHILTAHEQGAAHAADGYSRASGQTGVCIATSGPGSTNLVTGIATAYMDSIPMVAITGNVPLALLGTDGFQEVDITGITLPVTKHNFIVKDVKDLADTIRRAFYIANEGRKGPVLVDIPKDIMLHECEYSPQPVVRPNNYMARTTEEQLNQVIQLLQSSQRPFIYTGGGVISSGAFEQVKTFATLMDAPVSSSLMGQGGYDNLDFRYMGMVGMHGTKTASLAVTDCDVFIGLGTRFSDRVIGDVQSFAKNAKILHVDIDPAEVNKNITVDFELIGDVKYLLDQLNQRLSQHTHRDWMKKIQQWKQQYPLFIATNHGVQQVASPQKLLEILEELTDGQGVFSTEVGQHQMWAAQFLNFRHPRQFITSGGLGSMGFGLGAAMGAKCAMPHKKVINIAGDGSFQMNSNELCTAKQYKIGIVQLVLNNNTLGMVRQWQTMFYDKRYSATTRPFAVDYSKLAEAYQIPYYRIETDNQIKEVLQQALAQESPVLVECLVDPDLFVLPMVPSGGSVSEPILEFQQ